MIGLSGSGPPRSKGYTIGWGITFFVVLFMSCAAMYVATKQVDYTWRWYLVPQYFYYLEDVETKAEIDGEIDSILTQGASIVLEVKGEDGNETYTMSPETKIMVDEGDYVYAGDTLGKMQEWQAGMLLQGLNRRKRTGSSTQKACQTLAYQPACLSSVNRIASARRSRSNLGRVISPRMRTANPGPGKGWRSSNSPGNPSSAPSARTSSLKSSLNGSSRRNRIFLGNPPTLWWLLISAAA